MENLHIDIRYIGHSGFQILLEKNMLIFDYYVGAPEWLNKDIFVFSSHIHSDHYNPEIFTWQHKNRNIQYILSSDILKDKNLPTEMPNINFLAPYEEKRIKEISIQTYGSTDEGVSYLVRSEGISIFHAGDLNWWYWWDDSLEEIEKAETLFKDEIAKIKGQPIDLAFFPVDPRLEQYFSVGAEYFIQEIRPKVLVPMHFGEDYCTLKKFKEKVKGLPTEIPQLTHPGQVLHLQIQNNLDYL